MVRDFILATLSIADRRLPIVDCPPAGALGDGGRDCGLSIADCLIVDRRLPIADSRIDDCRFDCRLSTDD
jgi:hypothetical protein